MIKARKAVPTIGCLMIDEPASEGRKLGGLSSFLSGSGVNTAEFQWKETGEIHSRLLSAFEKACSKCAVSGIIARGSGCTGAIALAAQLQVDRLILVQPRRYADSEDPSFCRGMNRLRAFARRNAFFCVSDVLIAKTEKTERYTGDIDDSLMQCRISRMKLCVADNKKMCTNGEYLFGSAIYSFLRTGELPKSLAENPEMCIIYE